jgi:ACR3 family arsenite efflux pump ArsB
MATISLYTTKKENTPTLNQIFIISILFAIAGYLFGFNILTIFYIEILLLVYYAIISMIKGIPIKKSDVYLNNGYVCKDVYITDNTSSEFITVLNKRNVTIKIMKSSIMQIVDEHKRIGNQNITEQIPNMLNNMLNR